MPDEPTIPPSLGASVTQAAGAEGRVEPSAVAFAVVEGSLVGIVTDGPGFTAERTVEYPTAPSALLELDGDRTWCEVADGPGTIAERFVEYAAALSALLAPGGAPYG